MMEPIDVVPRTQSSIQVRRYLMFLLKYWWVPTITLILGAVAGVEYLYWAPSSYVSSASMWETEKLRLPDGGVFTGDTQNFLGTQIELLRSGALAQLAMQRLHDAGSNTVPVDKDGRTIQAQVSITQVPKSSILIVEATSPDAAFSRAYLDALLNEYFDFKKNLRKSVSDYTLASISEQVLRLGRELNDQQNTLTDFERTNNLAILQEEGNISGAYLAKLDTQLSDSQLELKLLDANEAEQQKNGKRGVEPRVTMAGATSGQAGQSASAAGEDRRNAASEIAMLRMEREKLSKYLRPKHPKIVKLDEDIHRAEKLNEIYSAQNLKELEVSRQVLQSRIDGLQAAVHEWEAKVMKANSGIAEADRLKLNVDRVKAVYDRLLGTLQNIDISRNIDQEPLAILQRASPAVRSRKKEEQKAVATATAGLFAGLGIVFLIGWRDDRFTSLSEMSEKFGEVIVGQVPELPSPNGQSSTPLLQMEDERQMYAESYRNLRSALLFMPAIADRPKVMIVTSAMPHEGKSTIALNLARTLAQGGSRVLLIDADLRRGHLHELLGMKREPGFSDLLQHPEEMHKILQTNGIPNFSFLARGSSLNRPGDFFVGPVLEQLLALFRQQFAVVIMDTSPVFASDDVTTLAPRSDGALFVVRRGVSRSSCVTEALAVLARRQTKLLGIVINGARTNAKSYYYYKNEEYYQPVLDNLQGLSRDEAKAKQHGPTQAG